MRTRLGLLVLGVLLLAVGVAVTLPADIGDDGDGVPSNESLSFAEVSDVAGLDYASVEGGAGNGNDGLYVADVDGDLRDDVLAIGGPEPVLYESTAEGYQRTGALPNVSAPDAGRVQSALWLDRDRDGDQDLLMFRRNATPVALENDEGTFERVDAGLEDSFTNPVGATTADYDGDGCLDLFVIQNGDWTRTTPAGWNDQFWEVDNGEPNALYRGSCGDGFERVADAGIGPDGTGAHWSLATSFADLNDDGAPDIHVSNDYYNDTIYRNDGDGTFTKVTLGAATDRNGMSSEVADVTGDGRPELFVTNIYFPRERVDELRPLHRDLFTNFLSSRLGKRLKGNNVLTANGSGYDDVGSDLRLAEGGWGWAAALADLDSDGQLDAAHSTQTVVTFDEEEPVYELPMVWVGHGGQFYRQDAEEIGLEIADGRGLARTDFDVDGALDLAVATYDEPYMLYENRGDQGESLQVRVGGGAETVAVGAEVYATVDGEEIHRRATARTDYQSQESRVVHLGLGEAETVEELRVVWPDGTERTVEDVEAGQRIRVTPDGIQQRLEYDG